MSKIKELIKEIDNLAPMPSVVNQIMSIVETPNSSMADIADIIRFDPILTANVLKATNSAYYSLPRRIDSVQDAITLIGIEQVVDIVLLKSASGNFGTKQVGYGLHEGELWKCAVSSAIIARELAKKMKSKHHHVLFTAALIKDIGKIILDRFINDSFDRIKNLVDEKEYSFMEAEKKVIGIDHAEIGGLIASKWGFSKKMVSIIRNHHMTNLEQADLETAIVYLADNVCMMMGIGVGEDGLAYRFHNEVLRKSNIKPVDIEIIIAGYGENMKKVESLLNVF